MHSNQKNPLGSRGKNEPKRVNGNANENENQNHNQNAGSPKEIRYATTEPCVDLKMLLRAPMALMPGEAVMGTLGRDSIDHFTFLEQPKEEKAKRRRPKYVYRGELVNVVEQPDGTRILTLRKVCWVEKNSARFEQSQARLGMPNRSLFRSVEKNHQTMDFLGYC